MIHWQRGAAARARVMIVALLLMVKVTPFGEVEARAQVVGKRLAFGVIGRPVRRVIVRNVVSVQHSRQFFHRHQ